MFEPSLELAFTRPFSLTALALRYGGQSGRCTLKPMENLLINAQAQPGFRARGTSEVHPCQSRRAASSASALLNPAPPGDAKRTQEVIENKGSANSGPPHNALPATTFPGQSKSLFYVAHPIGGEALFSRVLRVFERTSSCFLGFFPSGPPSERRAGRFLWRPPESANHVARNVRLSRVLG